MDGWFGVIESSRVSAERRGVRTDALHQSQRWILEQLRSAFAAAQLRRDNLRLVGALAERTASLEGGLSRSSRAQREPLRSAYAASLLRRDIPP